MAAADFDWLKLHRAMCRAGLTKPRAAFQSDIGHLVEDVAAAVTEISGESYYDWMMTGSFVEGWGNHLFRLDGVTGGDSDIDWSQVVKHKVYHLAESCKSIVDCINRKEYVLRNGHIEVKNCSQQPAFNTDRHGLRPDTDECHAYPCCSYPRTVLDSRSAAAADAAEAAAATSAADQGDQVDGKVVCPQFIKILRVQFDNDSPVEDVHFVRASIPGEQNQMRLSCTRQERFIMSQLTTVQGQLFTILKYMFKVNVDEDAPKKEKKKILEHLKSFHAKTLLMTLLRDASSWPQLADRGDMTASDDNGTKDLNINPEDLMENDEANAAKQLEHLVLEALTILRTSIKYSIGSYSTELPGAAKEESPKSKEAPQESTMPKTKKIRIPIVLNHALLHDCGLYLKIKKNKDDDKIEEHERNYKALEEVQAAVENLLKDNEAQLKNILAKYLESLELTLSQRSIPSGASDAPGYTSPEPEFLFIPLLMLPRITLGTLLEESEKNIADLLPLDVPQVAPQDAPKDAPQDAPKDAPQVAPQLALNLPVNNEEIRKEAANILKCAYIAVWVILRSLSASSKDDVGVNDGTDADAAEAGAGAAAGADQEARVAVQQAWKWVKAQACLKTAHQCLSAMQLIKRGAPDAKVREILQTDHKDYPTPTKRWISLGENFLKFLKTENCVWAFHYFVRPKEKMDFSYLNDVQDAWAGADARVLECWMKKSWMTHLKYEVDSKNRRQPYLTVNFDGLLDSFRRCRRFRASGTSFDPRLSGGGEFLGFMQSCLFDPRKSKKKKN